MPRQIGRLTSLGLGKETVRGTAVAPVYWIPVLELDFDDKVETKENESGFGNIANFQENQITRLWGDGSYGGKIYDLSVGLELTALFGQSPTSVQRGVSGVYDHTYTMLNSNSHQSVTVAIKEGNYDGRWPNGVFDSWKLESDLDDYIKRTIAIASKQSASASNTVAYTNENEFLGAHLSVKLAAVGGDLTAAAVIKCRGINLEINKNAEPAWVYGSKTPDDIHNKQLEVTGDFEMYYDARTYHALATAGTHQSMRIEMLNNEVTIGGSHNPALRFDLSNIALTFPEKNFDNNDLVTITIPFHATLDLTAGSVLTARLTNLYSGSNY